MPLTDGEFASILSDDTKRIEEDLTWTEDEDHSPAFEFRVNVDSMRGGHCLSRDGTTRPPGR